MGSALFFFCVISTITTTSYSLSCIECKDATDVPCTGSAETCSSPDAVCVSKYAVTSVAGVPISKMFMRGCGDRAHCSESGSMSVPHARIVTSASCCYTSLCNPPRPVLPPTKDNKNGVVCKSCQAIQESPCDSDTYMECVGNETKCISQVTETSGSPPMAIRGCATPDICKIQVEKGTFGHLSYSSKSFCTDGGAALHHRLYLLAVTLICLFKVIH